VIKDANVEVHEEKTSGLSRIEPSDLSSRLRLNVDRPIVLSYKYLNPENAAFLSVKEHATIETLEASIDRLHYKVVVTETHAVHSVMLVLQSTKLQYLEMANLPSSASQFTVAVNSVPAKPVKGDGEEKNSILVPLLIGLNPETANQGASLLTSVEVTYFSAHTALSKNGTIALNPPEFKLPISVLTTHLTLPLSSDKSNNDRHRYTYTFTGDFGTTPTPMKYLHPLPQVFAYVKGKRVVRDDHVFTFKDDMIEEEERKKQETQGAVKIVTPQVGKSFYFQKFLVLDTALQLNVTYRERNINSKKSSSWSVFNLW